MPSVCLPILASKKYVVPLIDYKAGLPTLIYCERIDKSLKRRRRFAGSRKKRSAIGGPYRYGKALPAVLFRSLSDERGFDGHFPDGRLIRLFGRQFTCVLLWNRTSGTTHSGSCITRTLLTFYRRRNSLRGLSQCECPGLFSRPDRCRRSRRKTSVFAGFQATVCTGCCKPWH